MWHDYVTGIAYEGNAVNFIGNGESGEGKYPFYFLTDLPVTKRTVKELAEAGDREVTFTELMLGIYVIDTAGSAKVTIMWDMDWQSDIKEDYKPEDKAEDSGTTTGEKSETQEESGGITEEDTADENEVTDSQNAEAESAESVVESTLPAEETSKGNSSIPVIIVAIVVVLVTAAAIFFIKKKK